MTFNIKNIFSWSATLGFLFYLSAFTFIGAALCTPVIAWSIAAVVFAVVVEGTVYATNIFEAARNIDYKEAVELALAEEELKELQDLNNTFIEEYFKFKKYLHELSENLASYNKADKEEAEKRITSLKKHLAKMVALYRDFRKGKTASNLGPLAPLINSLSSLPDFEAKAKSRITQIKTSIGGAIASGIFSGISAYAGIVFKFLPSPFVIGCLTKLGISLSVASLVGAPLLAVMAGLGSMLMLYGSASKVIKRGKLGKWFERIHTLAETNAYEDEPHPYLRKFLSYLKKGLLYVIFPAVIVCAAIAAAWSFFSPVINFSINIVLKVLACIGWPFMIALNLLFDADNALESMQKIAGDLARAGEDIKTAWHDENILQFINPFRHARGLIMLCHAYSFGISTDNFPFPLPPFITAFFGMSVEGLTDWHYGAESNHNEDDEDDHGSFLDTLMLFFNYLAAEWDYRARGKDYLGYSWQKAKDKFMPSSKLSAVPPISLDLQAWLARDEMATKAKEYGEKGTTASSKRIAHQKQRAFKQIQAELLSVGKEGQAEAKEHPSPTLHSVLRSALVNHNELKQHRYYGFFNRKPTSENVIENLLTDPILRISAAAG